MDLGKGMLAVAVYTAAASADRSQSQWHQLLLEGQSNEGKASAKTCWQLVARQTGNVVKRLSPHRMEERQSMQLALPSF